MVWTVCEIYGWDVVEQEDGFPNMGSDKMDEIVLSNMDCESSVYVLSCASCVGFH